MDKITQVLEHLREEHKRLSLELAGLERAIAALEQAASPDWTPAAATAAPPNPAPFANLTVYEATASYLHAAGKPLTAHEIADGLRANGFPTRSQNFVATVSTMLRRTESASAYGIKKTDNGHRFWVRERSASTQTQSS